MTFHLPADFKPYVKPHGNSKSTNPYHPTWPSTLTRIKEESVHSGPKEVVSCVSTSMGGVMGDSAPGQLPRNDM